MLGARVSPILAAAAVACVAAGVVTTASASAAAAAAAGTPLLHRKLLNHNSENFRVLAEGGAHNALNGDADIEDQVTATTCLPTDDFVRTSGGKFTLAGRRESREILFPSRQSSSFNSSSILSLSSSSTPARALLLFDKIK